MSLKLFFKGFGKGIKLFGESIALIINIILLAIAYIIGVGITSVIAKIFRKRFLETKIQKNAKSYWKDLNLKKEEDNYYKQF